MLLKTEGIILRTMKYRETSVISDVYTAEKGMLSVLANGVRKQKSRMGAALFQPSSIVDIVLYYKESSKLHRLKEIKIVTPLFSINEKIKKIAIAQFIIEISKKTATNQDPSPQLFSFIKNHLIQLENAPTPDSLQPLKFLMELCPFLGITPDFDHVRNGFFDMKEGTTVLEQPNHPHFLNPEKAAILMAICKSEISPSIKLEDKREILSAMLDYYKIHLDGMKELNSPEILRVVLEK